MGGLLLIGLSSLLGLAGPLAKLPQVSADDAVEFEIAKTDHVRALPTPDAGLAVLTHHRADDTWSVTWLDESLDPQEYHPVALPTKARLDDWNLGPDGPVISVVARREIYTVTLPNDHSAPRIDAQLSPLEVRRINDLEIAENGGRTIAVRHKRGRSAVLYQASESAPWLNVELPRALGRKPYLGRLSATEDGLDLEARPRGKRKNLLVVSLKDGQQRGMLTLPSLVGHTLLTAQRSTLGQDTPALVGAYALGDRAYGTQGIYIARGPDYADIRLYDFSDFTDFFAYLPERKQDRVSRKKAKKEAKGERMDLRLSVLLHDLVQVNDRVHLVGEVVFPEYHSETRTRTRTVSNTVNGVMQTRTITENYTVQVFDGWRFTHAFIATFDQDGNLAWTHAFPMGDVLSFSLKPRIRGIATEDGLILRYAVGRRLNTQRVEAGVLVTRDKQRIDSSRDERVAAAWNTDTAYWHDDVFALWGQQKLKGGGRKRFAFFVRTIRE